MAISPSLSADDAHRFHVAVTASMHVRNHFDVLSWLQGELQDFLPHDVLIASWGNFQLGDIHHDLLSRLPGARSNDANNLAITPMMLGLHARWTQFGFRPFSLNLQEPGVLGGDDTAADGIGAVLRQMRSAVVHGITDQRGSHHCLYVGFSADSSYSAAEHRAFEAAMPYIDTALRQVAHLPLQNRLTKRDRRASDQAPTAFAGNQPPGALTKQFGLSEREVEVLHWVAQGKTNPEIAMILDISAFTVKNHMQRLFRKLDVSNRAQAVSKYRPSAINVQV